MTAENARNLGRRARSPGPLVRPYAMTGGRTRPAVSDIDLITVVVPAAQPADTHGLEPEHLSILSLLRAPLTVAEISAHLDLPLTVTRVLVGDLVARGLLLSRAPVPAPDLANLPELDVLQAVLDGIRRL
ncbi:DUF742 domain-containing protein [Lipingzhangella sp. LS1_29]|uniref:DUF742 domain-containing protein n=1 Tax=Lipingzhangella rawalii TaxID=2055835 RepID=A0ABU2H7V5_9ACTN|nr:DUF742 domain-containing protein [Lipingzhangella rawalii]MDS1271396.1 DUF742 domain-containing protein [Lipingzhangella rawalii]